MESSAGVGEVQRNDKKLSDSYTEQVRKNVKQEKKDDIARFAEPRELLTRYMG